MIPTIPDSVKCAEAFPGRRAGMPGLPRSRPGVLAWESSGRRRGQFGRIRP